MASAASGPNAECRIVVLCSGSGTNFQALLDGCASGRIAHSRIVRMFYNRAKAYAAQRADAAGVPREYFNLVAGGFLAAGEKDPQKLAAGRERFDAALVEKLLHDKPDLIVLAGWMHVFTEAFLEPLEKGGVPVINLHPALPGCYDGAKAIERAFNDFQAGKLENNRTGVMVHYVIREVDRGEAILVQEVECREGDTLEALEERIHKVEHELLVDATAKVAAQTLLKK